MKIANLIIVATIATMLYFVFKTFGPPPIFLQLMAVANTPMGRTFMGSFLVVFAIIALITGTAYDLKKQK